MRSSLWAFFSPAIIFIPSSPAQIRLNSDPATPLATFYGAAVGDYNGDGIPDVATLATESQYLQVALGDGNGFFHGASLTPIGDMNQDSRTDLAFGVANRRIRVLLSTDNGGFSISDYPVGVYPLNIAIADLNGDGYPEIIVTSEAGDVGILINQKDGTFPNGGAWGGGGSQTLVGSFASVGVPSIASGLDLFQEVPAK